MPKIIILQGLPASGKSTWAKEQVEKGQGKIKRVNKDDLREMIDCGQWSRENERFVLSVRDFVVRNALVAGLDVIVDDTNFAEEHINRMKSIAEDIEAEVEVKFFECDVHECIKRDSQRVKSVGKKVIMGMYDKYLKAKDYQKPEYNPKLPTAIIVDIDGTLAKMCDRSPFEYAKAIDDDVHDHIADIVRKYYGKVSVIILSGRDEECEQVTRDWLSKNGILFDHLYMRPRGNNEKDAIIKQRIYDNEIKERYNVHFILDDRDQVVEMWRANGLPCLQVAEGNF